MTGANAASCSSAKGHVIELGAPIGDHASELPAGNATGGCRCFRGIAGKGRAVLGIAESVMPQRDPIDDVKADVIEIDL
jgi:hypothetical protein